MRLNGYPVIHRREWLTANGAPSSYEMIIAFREEHDPHPYVVAIWHPSMGDSWNSGDYFGDLEEAMSVFNRRFKAGQV